jgi:uncharacterized protein YidB (DUF937 family)
MGLLDNLLGASLSGQDSHTGVAGALLGLLASEAGRADNSNTASPGPAAQDQSPAAVSGGLSELVRRFEQGGLGEVIQSWMASGSNQPVAPEQLHQAIGPVTMTRLSAQTGLDQGQSPPLSAHALPMIVDRLSPNQRIPQEHEVARLQSNRPIEV